MAFPIPRIQYNNVDTTGTTAISSGTISSMATVVGLTVGMFIRGVGIPTGATIGTVGTDYVVLALGVLCTANGAGIAVACGTEIAFDYPPVEPDGEILNTDSTQSTSLSGITQTSVNYVQGVRKVKFSFVSPTIYALLDTFLRTFALLGNEFRYYDDKTTDTYTTVELNTLKATPVKITSRSATTYVWEVPLELRRAL